MSEMAKEAIENNAEILLLTIFIVFDLLLTFAIIEAGSTLKPVPVIGDFYAAEMRRIVFDYQLLKSLFVGKSLVLYGLAIAIGKRL